MPVAADGETVAVKVMLVPVVVAVLEAATEVVVDVVSDEELVEPQPVDIIDTMTSTGAETQRIANERFTLSDSSDGMDSDTT